MTTPGVMHITPGSLFRTAWYSPRSRFTLLLDALLLDTLTPLSQVA
jgi:hypothetical protein